MGETQDDAYAARRAELEAQFQGLPPAGSGEYWRRIEATETDQQLTLEALARCCRERIMAGKMSDAHRIFAVIAGRTRSYISRRAASFARQAGAGAGAQDPADLEQVCYMKLWEELAREGPTFLLEHFDYKLGLICQHVAHSEMEKSGVWKRPGVGTPTRIPRSAMQSIHADPEDGGLPLAAQLVSTEAQNDLTLADYSDLLAEVEQLPREERAIIHALFYEDRTQEDIAEELGVTARTIRNRLKTILQKLRLRYQGGLESQGGDNV